MITVAPNMKLFLLSEKISNARVDERREISRVGVEMIVEGFRFQLFEASIIKYIFAVNYLRPGVPFFCCFEHALKSVVDYQIFVIVPSSFYDLTLTSIHIARAFLSPLLTHSDYILHFEC